MRISGEKVMGVVGLVTVGLRVVVVMVWIGWGGNDLVKGRVWVIGVKGGVVWVWFVGEGGGMEVRGVMGVDGLGMV